MSVALKLYEQLTEAPDDKTRARLIAEAFEAVEERYPEIRDLATQGHVRESELRLQKEIKEVEAKLRKEIAETKIEIKEVEGRLQKEIKEVEVRLVQAMHRQTLWIIGAVGGVMGLIRFIDHLMGA